VSLLQQLPFYPVGGVVGTLLGLVWLFALTGLVPYLLTRYRKLGSESYGLDTDRHRWSAGLLLAAPIVVAGIVRGMPLRGSFPQALLGRFSPLVAGDPTIRQEAVTAPNLVVEVLIALVLVVLLAAGALLLYTFLTVRGRDAFSRKDLSVTEAVRTIGMGSVAAALVFGLLRAIGPDLTVLGVLVNVATLATFVLLGDRLIPANVRTNRAAILTPLVVAVLAHVLQLMRGDLLFGLYAASLAAGLVTVVASILEGRAYAWAIIAPIVAMAVYPTCLSLLPFATNPFGC
jgi:hypothetical protein